MKFLLHSSFLIVLALLSLSLGETSAKAATLTVCPTGIAGQNGCQYIGGEGIQQAVDAAKDGDTVLIKNGTYTNVGIQIGENNHPAKQHLKIQGESRHTTILDGGNKGDVIRVREDSIVSIENLTIENAGLSSVSIRGTAKVTVTNNSIRQNGANGILVVGQARATITNNVISGNDAFGIIFQEQAQGTITNNQINNNVQGGVYAGNETRIIITNNTLVGNKIAGINIYQHDDRNPSATILNNIITGTQKGGDNTFGFGIGGPGLFNPGKLDNDKIAYNLTFGNEGEGTSCGDGEFCDSLHADPKFVSSTNFALQLSSPAIDAGDPNIKDTNGTRSDMGMYGGPNACPGSNCPSAFKPILLNSSFEWKNFNKWHYGSGVDITTSMVHDCLQWGPCSDGRYYLVLTRKLGGDQTKTDFSTEWIETGQDLGGKKIRVSFDAKAHSVDPVHQPPPALEGLYAQREHPVGSGWLQKIPIPKTVLTGEWKEYSFELEIPASESINTTRFRVVLKPELNYSGYQLGYYYDNMRVELIDAAPPPTNTPVQTQESDVNGDGHITLADYDQIVADFANYNLQLLNKVVSFLMQ